MFFIKIDFSKMKLSEAARVRLLYFFTFCCQAAWLPRYADFLTKKGFAGLELGVLMSVPPAMMFAAQPVFGFFADRFGHRKTLIWSAAAAAFFFAAHLFLTSSFWLVAAVAAGMALFFNATQPVVDALALRAAERDERVSYGRLRFWGAAAWSLTGLANGWLIDVFDLEIMFWTAAAAMILTVLVALTLPKKGEPKSLEADGSALRIPHSAFEKAPSLAADLRAGIENRPLFGFLAAVALVSVAQTPIWNFYSLFMTSIGATSQQTGWGLALQGLCELPLFYFSARIIERLGLKKALLGALAATVGRMILYSLATSPVAALGIEVLHGISWSLFWVVAVETVDKKVKTDQKALGQSLLYAAYFGIGAIVGNFWTSFLIQKITLGQVFLLNAGIVAVVALFLMMRDEW